VFLVAFAWATWIYRAVVFIGIAALVYAFFIKAVGVLLFIVEVVWFLLMPLWSEVKLWPALLAAPPHGAVPGTHARRRSRVRRSALLAGALALLVVLPWPTRQSASGLLRPVEVFPIHAPAGAQVVRLPWASGSHVGAGQMLIELSSPELRLRWSRAQARLERVRWEAGAAGVNAEQRQNLRTLQQDEATARAELASVRAEMDLYAPTAPFDGVLRDVEPDLGPGVWVGKRERLAVLVKGGAWQVETYLDEDAVRRIAVGDEARFFSDGAAAPVVALRVTGIDRDASAVLPSGQLAAQHGGSVIARETRETHDRPGQLVPDRAVFRVTLAADNETAGLTRQSWRGHVVIDGRWEAPALIFLRSALVVVWREFGF
jgi:putative peptide zinc metalloprotease protein